MQDKISVKDMRGYEMVLPKQPETPQPEPKPFAEGVQQEDDVIQQQEGVLPPSV